MRSPASELTRSSFVTSLGDAVPDELDRGQYSCANDPEDFDGFEDNDGCPDPDNDRDTTLDINDMCPMKLVHVLTVSRETRLEIQGHTDGRDSEGEVKRLGELRAEEVKRHLVRRGIDASRLNTCGYGGERPIAPPKLDAEIRRKVNRRVQFVVITNEPACAAPTPPWPPGGTR